MTSKDWWQLVKPQVRMIEQEDGVIIVDDSIVEKPYTDENEIICWHYDHSKERTVKGINFVTTLYCAQDVALPVTYTDKKTGKNALAARDLRRTCARNASDNGATVLQVQTLLGHSDPKTTIRYIGALDDEDTAAVDMVKY